jgi:hypothetical protein
MMYGVELPISAITKYMKGGSSSSSGGKSGSSGGYKDEAKENVFPLG